jgi:hypothetical protein
MIAANGSSRMPACIVDKPLTIAKRWGTWTMKDVIMAPEQKAFLVCCQLVVQSCSDDGPGMSALTEEPRERSYRSINPRTELAGQ